jgi:hypothetical protein
MHVSRRSLHDYVNDRSVKAFGSRGGRTAFVAAGQTPVFVSHPSIMSLIELRLQARRDCLALVHTRAEQRIWDAVIRLQRAFRRHGRHRQCLPEPSKAPPPSRAAGENTPAQRKGGVDLGLDDPPTSLAFSDTYWSIRRSGAAQMPGMGLPVSSTCSPSQLIWTSSHACTRCACIRPSFVVWLRIVRSTCGPCRLRRFTSRQPSEEAKSCPCRLLAWVVRLQGATRRCSDYHHRERTLAARTRSRHVENDHGEKRFARPKLSP